MKYILIDNFNGNINIITKDDGSGEVLIFESLKEAKEQLSEQCQDGIIVPLTNIIELFEEVNKVLTTELKLKSLVVEEVLDIGNDKPNSEILLGTTPEPPNDVKKFHKLDEVIVIAEDRRNAIAEIHNKDYRLSGEDHWYAESELKGVAALGSPYSDLDTAL